jgi:hypothetical protein
MLGATGTRYFKRRAAPELASFRQAGARRGLRFSESCPKTVTTIDPSGAGLVGAVGVYS